MNFDWKILQEILQFTITMMIGTSIDDRLFKTEFKNSWYVEATTKTKNKKSTLKVENSALPLFLCTTTYLCPTLDMASRS